MLQLPYSPRAALYPRMASSRSLVVVAPVVAVQAGPDPLMAVVAESLRSCNPSLGTFRKKMGKTYTRMQMGMASLFLE